MKVILMENVDRLGYSGDVVTVKEGYARNYLIPNKKAKEASDGNMKMLEALNKKKALGDKKILDEAKALADKISTLSLTIPMKAGDEEKLFGSVSNDIIANALAAEGVTIDEKDITLDENIKKLGVYHVDVKVHPEVKARLKVWVVKE